METTISDLTPDLVEEILSRVPLTSLGIVRSTSRQWNNFSKDRIVCKAEAKRQFLGFMTIDRKVFSVRFNLQSNLHGDPLVKKIGKLDQFMVHSVFHCDGLVLCLTRDESSKLEALVAWNPYLGQTRLIQPKTGYCWDNYGLGCDSFGSYKILRVSVLKGIQNAEIDQHEIYDFDSDSWRPLDVTPDWNTDLHYSHGVSLKGNAYWYAFDRNDIDWEGLDEDFLLCFDFTRERFGPRLELPPLRDHLELTGALACVREEKLAVLFKHQFSCKIEIWVTTKIEPEFVSWSKFLVFDRYPGNEFTRSIQHGRYFIDEEKKVAWLFDSCFIKDHIDYGVTSRRSNIAYMVGEGGYYREVDLGEPPGYTPIVCSYVPSLVQIE